MQCSTHFDLIILTSCVLIIFFALKSTLLEIKEHIPVICFDAPYNRNIDSNNLYRVSNWDEILKIILNYKNETNKN